jgi:hypothetical protein
MNSYISSNEKAQLIRVILMKDVLKDAIDIYAELDSTDKAFLAELRHGRTRIEKAVKLRRIALDREADGKLTASVAKLEPMFLAKPEARKAHKEILELQSILPIDINDMQDWYGFVIESTCATCTKADYEECPARRVLSKYEICPMDPGAKGKCQYSYAAGEVATVENKAPGIIEKPEFASLGSVSFEEMFAAKRQIQDLEQQIVILQDQLLAKSKNLAEEREEREISIEIDDENENDYLPVTLALNSGIKINMPLPVHMTKCLMEEIQRPNRLARSICAKYVDGEFVAIDMQEVGAIHVSGLPDEEWIRPQPVLPVYEFTTEQERYRVECKCGAEYFCKMNPNRPKARCRDCQGTVFADRQAEEIIDSADGTKATLLTNRYFVSRELDKANVPYLNNSPGRELRDISKNNGLEYIDPCRIVG